MSKHKPYNWSLLQNAYNPYAQQSYAPNMANFINQTIALKNYCINGNWMTLEEFANYIYPEDCAEKTFLLLRLNEHNENNSGV
jgi:hypothetical protein